MIRILSSKAKTSKSDVTFLTYFFYSFLFPIVLQDYKGQKLAEQIFQGIILISAVTNTNQKALRFIPEVQFTDTPLNIFPGDWIRVWSDH